MTSTQVCDSDAVIFTLQEVKTGYIKYSKGTKTHPESDAYTAFKVGFTDFLEQECHWERESVITDEEDFHGHFGTKSGLNSQISISFARRYTQSSNIRNIAVEHSHISTCPTSKPSEKGGMLIKITKDDMKALVVGVHLDSGKYFYEKII